MELHEKLDFLTELISCNYKIYRWQYSADLALEYTDCPPELSLVDAVDIMDLRDILQRLLKEKRQSPVLLESSIQLQWIAEAKWEDGRAHSVHLLGPAFTGKNSYNTIKKDLDAHNIHLKLRSQIFRQIEKIPVIPSSVLAQHAIMLHHILCGTQISYQDIRLYSQEPNREAPLAALPDDHRGVWAAEQQLLDMFRKGNPAYWDAIDMSSNLSSGVKFDVGDTLRQNKNNGIVLLTLISRATIEGGLNPAISYSLNDHYMQKIEECASTTELSHLLLQMMGDYIARVREVHTQDSISKQIQNCCDYIKLHVEEPLTIDSLADRFGYTTYYFSNKFKKELGCSVKDYIKQAKIEQAKILLSTTKRSVQEICDDLSFGSRSAFTVSFHEATGVSPAQYRKDNWKG